MTSNKAHEYSELHSILANANNFLTTGYEYDDKEANQGMFLSVACLSFVSKLTCKMFIKVQTPKARRFSIY